MSDTFTRNDLLGAGWSPKRIARAVHLGRLVRVRRGHYCLPDLEADVVAAVRVGGRLACVSELAARGVWVPDVGTVHVQVPANASRLRSPVDRGAPLSVGECVVHWSPLLDPGSASAAHVGAIDALASAARCLPPRSAVAAVDSALHLRLVALAELRSAWRHEPQPIRRLLDVVDARAESGLESIVRMLVTSLGLRVRIQVRFPGIGVADLVVEDWVVVETDGSRFHDDAVVSARDRRRDARHAAAGRTPLRFRYAQVVYDLRSVAEAIIGAVRSHRRVRNSGWITQRAVRRLHSLDFS